MSKKKGGGGKGAAAPDAAPKGLDPLEIYRRFERRPELEEVHERLISKASSKASDLLSPLRNTFSYVIERARLDAKSRVRAQARQAALALERSETLPALDPLAMLRQRDLAARLAQALATLSDIDAQIVWLHAEGYSDQEIHQRLAEKFPQRSSPSLESIRKRRERARKRLRETLAELGVTLGHLN